MQSNVLSVSELNRYIKTVLDADMLLSSLFIRGEISNFKLHSSGHMYFTLKDEEGAILCVMFRGEASRLRFRPDNGMKVIAHGRVSVFPRDGRYQLYVDELQPDGLGALYMAFEQLKARLGEEGLFDPSRKKPLPACPMKIAVVTSPTGAAVHDILRILRRRFPAAKVLVCPVRVQGEGAAAEISAAVRLLNEKRLVELMIVGRGGGSLEDLWPFNEEIVARAIAASDIPVISAVGHEPDVTISDFVADLRAATPSNAAELAVPDRTELRVRVKNLDARVTQSVAHRISDTRRRLDALASSKALQSPLAAVNEKRLVLDFLQKKLLSSVEARLADGRARLGRLSATVDALSPLKVLGRGYCVPLSEGRAVVRARDLRAGDRLELLFQDGRARCTVEEHDGFSERNG